MNPLYSVVQFLAALSLLLASAQAQFPGDIYLPTASNVVATSGELVLRVNTFTGTQRFGAVQFTLQFDPTVLRFIGSAEPTGSPLRVSSTSRDGHLGVVVTNATGVNDPFGVVPLADLRFLAIGQPMASSGLDLTAQAMISLSGTVMATAAVDGSVLVTSSSSAALAATLPDSPPPAPSPLVVTPAAPLVPNESERQRAVAMARPGQRITLWRAVQHGDRIGACQVEVEVAAASPPEPVPGSPPARTAR